MQLKNQSIDEGENKDTAIRCIYQHLYLVAVPRISKGGEGGGTKKAAVQIIAVHDKTAYDEAVETYNIGSPFNDINVNNPKGLGFFAYPSMQKKIEAEKKVKEARKVRDLQQATDELSEKLRVLGGVHCLKLLKLLEKLREDHMQFSIKVDSFLLSGSVSKMNIKAGGTLESKAPGGERSESVDKTVAEAEQNAYHEIVKLVTSQEAQRAGVVYTKVRHLLFLATRIERRCWENSIIGTGVQKQDWDWRHALQKVHLMPAWLIELEKKLDSFNIEGSHERMRVFHKQKAFKVELTCVF